MPRIKLTEAKARQIRYAKPQVDYFDTEAVGFLLRVGERTKSFYVRFRIRGQQKRYRTFLGRYPEVSVGQARTAALQILVEARMGRAPGPASTPAANEMRFGALVEEYLSKHTVHLAPRTAKNYRGVLQRLLVSQRPAWRRTPVEGIKRTELRTLLREVAAETPGAARALRVILGSVFAWGVEEGLVQSNPALRLVRKSEAAAFGPDQTRDRVLSPQEIRKLWTLLEGQNTMPARLLQALLLTGQRTGEIAKMRWSEIDSETHWWTPPKKIWKNKFPHRVYLSDPLREILARVKPFSKNGLVFPTAYGTHYTPTLQDIVRQKYLPKLGFEEPFWPSDSRGTFITGLASLKIREEIRHLCVNHKRRGVNARNYDMYTYGEEIQEAFETWSHHVLSLLNENVIPFRSGTGA